MKVIGAFNKISDKLKKEIPKLKQGQTVTFQMINGQPNPDNEERQKTPVLYPKVQIRTRDTIYDPYQKDSEGEEVGGFVEIGIVKSSIRLANGENDIETELAIPGMIMPGKPAIGNWQFNGKFSFSGDSIKDIEAFEFFWLSNENESNPHRDKSVKALFKQVNLLEDSKQTIKTTNDLREALNIAADLDETTAREIAASLNWANIAELPILTAKINDFATKFPTEFLKAYNSPKRKTKSLIRKALDSGIISFDPVTKTVTLGSEVVATLSLRSGEDFLTAFTDWINTAKNGSDVFGNIEGQIEQKRQESNSVAPKKKAKAEAV
jgi:hypothetical protein